MIYKLIRTLLYCVALMSLSACPEEDPGQGDNSGNGGSTPVEEQTEWGRLPCQKRLSCENPVLNLDYEGLRTFIEMNFPQDQSFVGDSDTMSFRCGRVFWDKWTQQYPQHFGAEKIAVKQIALFASSVMDIKKCTNQPDVTKSINNYFQQTKEYKNAN